jgi:hypothetical protein
MREVLVDTLAGECEFVVSAGYWRTRRCPSHLHSVANPTVSFCATLGLVVSPYDRVSSGFASFDSSAAFSDARFPFLGRKAME